MANGSSDDEKKVTPPTQMMNDTKEDGVPSPKLTIVIPKYVMKEDDELEEFKTPTGLEFMIPPPLVCPPAPKRMPEPKKPTPAVLIQTPLAEEVISFFESLYEKFGETNMKPECD
ncbi:hypothetical protein TSUD_102970 [Trifolium subterraneum]|uniref:Uncharacterized protein n=1 Tax=Trifolium subterraneum TaxID=3900 RepID=A0A2Z6NGD1_TRISU|nr:hypothetical protein TSUD_102970 [Trifolium subterraneum]